MTFVLRLKKARLKLEIFLEQVKFGFDKKMLQKGPTPASSRFRISEIFWMNV